MKCLLLLLFLTLPAFAQSPTTNDAMQDKAVVADQKRQDKADSRQNAVVATDNAVQDAKIAKNAAKVESINDRQFMLVMTAVIAMLLVAIWLLLQRGASRQHAASEKLQGVADILMKRTEVIEAEIAPVKKIVD